MPSVANPSALLNFNRSVVSQSRLPQACKEKGCQAVYFLSGVHVMIGALDHQFEKLGDARLHEMLILVASDVNTCPSKEKDK
ncbi:hypothetical protein CK203_094660 [Vitis vinifera]|uniref:Uncharacterized protein n=1 Tax=Vitis vinifera TaxID=29760 RepID=A0A438CL41_VITVI|nr:hypothetical protein CK203_094660 [Vitis vinifera]